MLRAVVRVAVGEPRGPSVRPGRDTPKRDTP